MLDFSSIYHLGKINKYLLSASYLLSTAFRVVLIKKLSPWPLVSLELGGMGVRQNLLSSPVSSPFFLLPGCKGFFHDLVSTGGWQSWLTHDLELVLEAQFRLGAWR